MNGTSGIFLMPDCLRASIYITLNPPIQARNGPINSIGNPSMQHTIITKSTKPILSLNNFE